MKTIITTLIVAVGVLFFIFHSNEEVEQVQEVGTVIIQDTKSVYDGLKDFVRKEEIKKKVELVEKEAFLNHRKEVLQKKYEADIAEIEAELDTVRGELSVS